jgi:hypothetical protein
MNRILKRRWLQVDVVDSGIRGMQKTLETFAFCVAGSGSFMIIVVSLTCTCRFFIHLFLTYVLFYLKQ